MSRGGRLALLWGASVVLGLAIETIGAATLDEGTRCYISLGGFVLISCTKFSRVFADILVTLGVFGEIWWNHKAANALEELRKRANAQVSSAQRETERLKSETAWRELSREQVASIGQVLRRNQPSAIEFRYFSADPESNVFARRIGAAFASCQWRVGYVGSSFSGKPEFGRKRPANAP